MWTQTSNVPSQVFVLCVFHFPVMLDLLTKGGNFVNPWSSWYSWPPQQEVVVTSVPCKLRHLWPHSLPLPRSGLSNCLLSFPSVCPGPSLFTTLLQDVKTRIRLFSFYWKTCGGSSLLVKLKTKNKKTTKTSMELSLAQSGTNPLLKRL